MDSIRRIEPHEFPELLRRMPGGPKALYIKGVLPPPGHKLLTVVGSRKHTDYGKEACETLIASLKGLPVAIVSGLALGIDSIAHRAALKNGLLTVAVPGSGLGEANLYPASHLSLAREIVAAGGALVSPFETDAAATLWSFPFRNRIMAGMSHATLVIEAERKSGTLITSKHATEFSRDVFALPGSIFSKQSDGPHMLIRLGATAISSGDNLREALGFSREDAASKKPPQERDDLSPDELKLVSLLDAPLSREALFERASAYMDTAKTSVLISLLELKGAIEEKLGLIRII